MRIIDDHEVCDMQIRAEIKRADKAEAELDRAYERYDQAEKDRNHWHDKAVAYKDEKVQAERELAYWHHQGLLYRARVEAVKALCDEMESGPRSKHSISHAFAHDIRKAINEAEAADIKDINVAKQAVQSDYPDNPWFGTVYEASTWRGTPIRPNEIRKGDLYDIHTAHGSAITGILAARNGVHRPQSGDQYRLVNRAT